MKRAGDEMDGEPVELIARHHPRREKSPYERLLGDAMRGDAALFTRDDVVEAAWRVVDPISARMPRRVIPYEPGRGVRRRRESSPSEARAGTIRSRKPVVAMLSAA